MVLDKTKLTQCLDGTQGMEENPIGSYNEYTKSENKIYDITYKFDVMIKSVSLHDEVLYNQYLELRWLLLRKPLGGIRGTMR